MKLLVLIISLTISYNASAQLYTVSYVKGKVYFNNKILAIGDKVNSLANLKSNDKNAILK